MRISSRTPEGSPNRCPVCGSDVRIDPSIPFGDAPCPHCGHLLWFLNLPSETRFFELRKAKTVRDRVLEIIAQQLGVAKEQVLADPLMLNDLNRDSLDTVELVMELEQTPDP